MTHEEALKYLDDYKDNDLPQETAAEVGKHINKCIQCTKYLFALRKLDSGIQQLPEKIDPPHDLYPLILADLRETEQKSPDKTEEVKIRSFSDRRGGRAKVKKEKAPGEKTGFNFVPIKRFFKNKKVQAIGTALILLIIAAVIFYYFVFH